MEEVLVAWKPFHLLVLVVEGPHGYELECSLRLESLVLSNLLLENFKRIQWEWFRVVRVVADL